MRVLHLPTSVGGGPTGLSRELRRLGVQSEVWALDEDYLDFDVDRFITSKSDSLFKKALKAVRAGSYIFGDWDIVNFNYGSTLFSNGGKLLSRNRPGKATLVMRIGSILLSGVAAVLERIELAVLSWRKIPIFVLYQGDDARQGDFSESNFEISIAGHVPEGYYSKKSDNWKRAQIRLLSKKASHIYAVNPDLLWVLPEGAEFLPYGHVPVREWKPAYYFSKDGPLKFVHAPSNRDVKGTTLIEDAVAALRQQGFNIELDLVEGLSNEEALRRIEDSDILIDQLFAGWYGGVAVEAMALGKPVVAYLRESDLVQIPAEMRSQIPIIRTDSDSLVETLRKIATSSRAELMNRARSSRRFAEVWHDAGLIAEKVARDYELALRDRRKKGIS